MKNKIFILQTVTNGLPCLCIVYSWRGTPEHKGTHNECCIVSTTAALISFEWGQCLADWAKYNLQIQYFAQHDPIKTL